MPRLRKNKAIGELTALAKALEAGKPVKGMIGFVGVNLDSYNEDATPSIYIKVKCLGLSTGNGCGLEVMVEPLSGAGTFTISPCRWIENTEELEALKDKDRRLAAANVDFETISSIHYLAVKQREIETYAKKNLSVADLNNWYDDVEERVGKRSLVKVSLDKLSIVLQNAILTVHGLTLEDIANKRWRLD